MARYKVILAYDGARFAGSQRQAKKRTVQGELEKALREIGWIGRSVIMAGRTDAGVHATGQVAAFDFQWKHSEAELVKALNAKLPDDLALSAAYPAEADFHPRFDAVARTYRYRLFCAALREPLRERSAWRAWPAVDAGVLSETAALFCGRHDFAAFGSPLSSEGTTVRKITVSQWQPTGDEWLYEVRADAFLYRMVRRLVYIQVAAAQGRLSAEAVAAALADQASGRSDTPASVSRKSGLPAGLAPAQGLTLVEVSYQQTSEVSNETAGAA